jgi:hypothetical protein
MMNGKCFERKKTSLLKSHKNQKMSQPVPLQKSNYKNFKLQLMNISKDCVKSHLKRHQKLRQNSLVFFSGQISQSGVYVFSIFIGSLSFDVVESNDCRLKFVKLDVTSKSLLLHKAQSTMQTSKKNVVKIIFEFISYRK